MNPNRSRRAVAPAAVLALVFAAACGGDDDGDTGGDADGSASVDAAPADPPTEAGDDIDSDDPVEGSADDGAGESAPESAPSGPPITLSDELHPLELPEPGTAVVTLAGETYVFGDMWNCGINDSGDRWTFNASASGELDDGSEIFFTVLRSVVVNPEVLSPSEWLERDFVQIAVEQEPGGGMSSNAWHDVNRDAPGDPIRGDGDVLPIIYVVSDGDAVAATAVAELTHPPLTGEFDRAGEGLGEFAVNCG